MVNYSKEDDQRQMWDYSISIANLLADYAENGREEIKKIATSYINQKKKDFSGLAYIEQLDKNYIYLERCVAAIGNHVNLFLMGEADIPEEHLIEPALNFIRSSTRDESAAHLKYLAFDCEWCNYHSEHSRYAKLREIRLSNINKYVDEMEFGCFFHKVELTLSQDCLVHFWKNKQFAGTFVWDKSKMNKIFYENARLTAGCVVNNQPLRTPDGTLRNFVLLNE